MQAVIDVIILGDTLFEKQGTTETRFMNSNSNRALKPIVVFKKSQKKYVIFQYVIHDYSR